MADINLVASTEKSDLTSHESSINSGTIIACGLLLLALAAYGGLYYYNKDLDKKIADAKSQYQTQITTLTSEKNLDTFDFQNRIAIAKKVIADKGAEFEAISNVEKSLLITSYIDSFSYDKKGKTVTLDCVAENFPAYVQQLASFKASQYFSNVTNSGGTFDEKGKVKFNLKLDIK